MIPSEELHLAKSSWEYWREKYRESHINFEPDKYYSDKCTEAYKHYTRLQEIVNETNKTD